jgi:hypothetical protein
MAPASRAWMSTRSDEENTNSKTGDLARPASRAAFLGNLVPAILADTAGVALTGIALALGLLYFQQDKLLYIPEIQGISRDNGSNPPGYQSPAEYDVPFETHMIENNGVSVHSWLLLHPRSKEEDLPTIVFFHGNAG